MVFENLRSAFAPFSVLPRRHHTYVSKTEKALPLTVAWLSRSPYLCQQEEKGIATDQCLAVWVLVRVASVSFVGQ